MQPQTMACCHISAFQVAYAQERCLMLSCLYISVMLLLLLVCQLLSMSWSSTPRGSMVAWCCRYQSVLDALPGTLVLLESRLYHLVEALCNEMAVAFQVLGCGCCDG